jgi:hypothetical protein
MANQSAAIKIVDKRHHMAPAVKTSKKSQKPVRVEVRTPAKGSKPRDLAYDDELADPELTPQEAADLAEYERREPIESHSAMTEDLYAELKEGNTNRVANYRWDNQEELGEEHEAERMGKAMHANELMSGLKRCGLECGLRKTKIRQMMGLDGVVKINGVMQVTYLCWVQVPWMPEYSVMYFDEHKLPTSEKYRGWRTVLTQLIQQGAITEADAKRVFGEPTGHMVSRRFRSQMYAIRNG